MPLSINIFDTQDLNANTVLEVGERSTINLFWSGSPEKLEHVLGSELSFNMMVLDFSDGFFAHLNAGDERRYYVTLVDEETGQDLWRGHLLPEQYNEPYKVGAFPVSFIASCGLGTLKEQYLPNDFYVEEKTKIQILSEILKLTGHELDMLVDPALFNVQNPLWSGQHLKTSQFDDDGDKDDAYVILTKLMVNTLCRIYQLNGQWYIEGVNKLGRYTRSFSRYNYLGVFVSTDTVEKSAKSTTFYGEPTVNFVMPLKTVQVSYKLDESNIDKGAYEVEIPGLVLATNEDIINHNWSYTSLSFTPKFNTEDGKTFFAPFGNNDNSIKLRKEILLAAGDRVEWVIEMSNYWDGSFNQGRTVEDIVLSGDWDKIQPYDIIYTDPTNGTEVLLYSNKNGVNQDDDRYQLKFDTDRNARLAIKMIAPASAYYNIRFYQPEGPPGIKVSGTVLELLELNNVSDTEEQVYSDVILETYTQNFIGEIEIHDDYRKLENTIRLSPLTDAGSSYGSLSINSLVTRTIDGGEYIELSAANLWAALSHPEQITVNGTSILVLGHIFNYLGSQEHYLQYDPVDYGSVIADGSTMLITYRNFAAIPSDVEEWQQWTDSFYNITPKRYGEAYVEVVRNLYQEQHPRIAATVEGFFTPQDIILFNYQGEKAFYVVDCEQYLDRYQTRLILIQNFYGQAATEKLPPVVDAGVDITLSPGVTTATLNAVASDPDGTIVSVLWKLISEQNSNLNAGDPSPVVIESPTQLQTNLSGLTGESYEFQVSVADNDGLTASDTIRLVRQQEYTLVLTQTVDVEKSTNPGNQDPFEALDREWYDMSISPELNEGQTVRVTIDGILTRQSPVFIAGAWPSVIFSIGYGGQYFEAGQYQIVTLLRRGESRTLILQAKAFNSVDDNIFPQVDGNVFARVQADITAEMVTGDDGVITNVPIQLVVEARK